MLSETMAKFGKILSYRITLDELGYSRGMASVVFFNESDANNAIIFQLIQLAYPPIVVM